MTALNMFAISKPDNEALSEKVDAFFLKSNCAIFIIEVESGNICEANKAALSFYGYSKEEILDHNISIINPSVDENEHKAARWAAFAGKRTVFDVSHVKSDGDVIFVKIITTPITLKNVPCLVSVACDVTVENEAKNSFDLSLKMLHEALKIRNDFLSSMSHELRTPLNAIMGFSEMIRSGLINSSNLLALNESVGHIYQSAQDMLTLIERLLDYSDIQSPNTKFHDEVIDLRSIVGNALKQLNSYVDKRHIRVSIFFNIEGIRVIADKKAVHKCLTSVIHNSVKFSAEGGAVYIEAFIDVDGGATLSIKDEGIGMTQEQITKMENAFEFGLNNTVRSQKGSGISIALASGIMRMHKGSLLYQSEKGKGTTAYLHFPSDRTISC